MIEREDDDRGPVTDPDAELEAGREPAPAEAVGEPAPADDSGVGSAAPSGSKRGRGGRKRGRKTSSSSGDLAPEVPAEQAAAATSEALQEGLGDAAEAEADAAVSPAPASEDRDTTTAADSDSAEPAAAEVTAAGGEVAASDGTPDVPVEAAGEDAAAEPAALVVEGSDEVDTSPYGAETADGEPAAPPAEASGEQEAGPTGAEEPTEVEGRVVEVMDAGEGADTLANPTAPTDEDGASTVDAAAAAADGEEELAPPVDTGARLESIIESLLFAADKALSIGDLKRILDERDTGKITAALEALKARHEETGIQLASVAGGWQLRTHPANAPWVSQLVAARPVRLSRAMLETLAIVAYRQPVTRPEIDEIRGVDSGPVLKTLLERSLIRMIGKKEEVGRPILYGTTSEFLRVFSLKDLTELPTLREFHELGAAEKARVDAVAAAKAAESGAAPPPPPSLPPPADLPSHDPAEEDAILDELDRATAAASRATKASEPTPPAPSEPEA